MPPDSVPIPLGWLLGIVGTLGGVIATLAVTMFNLMRSRLAAQDALVEKQNETIKGLQTDIRRLSNGCGSTGCFWHVRSVNGAHNTNEPI